MFENIIAKIADNKPLVGVERQEFINTMRGLNQARMTVKSWEREFDLKINPRAIDLPLIEGFFASVNSPISVPNNTETNVTFDQSSFPSEFYSRPDNDANIHVANTHRTIAVFGTVEWASNGTGRRAIHMNLYDKDDVKITGVTLHSLLPTGIAADTLPFSGGFWLPIQGEGQAYTNLHHIRLTVIQTSGGALNLNNARANFFCLR